MRYIATIILTLLCTYSGFSQTYEIGGFIGGTNFIGDVGNTSYIAPNRPAFGGIVKWNRSSRHSFRGTVIVGQLAGFDSKSNEDRRKERDYSFENTIMEVSVGLEYTFWDFNMYSGRPQSTPYLYTGLTYFSYNALRKRQDDKIVDFDNASSLAIPMVIGFKSTIGTKIVLGMEIGARYTFTDGIDGSSPVKAFADEESIKFGNTNSDDWYVFTGVTLSFTFGRKPCYCNF